jgi:hypothetical protein
MVNARARLRHGVVRSAISRSVPPAPASRSASSEEVASSRRTAARRAGSHARRDALALAARNDAALADLRGKTLRKPTDELRGERRLRGALDVGIARLRPAEAELS